MAAKTNSQRLAELRNKKKEEENQNSSSSSNFQSNSDILGKIRLENTIGLDTFESDLRNMGTTISGIYNGWQDSKTMSETKTSVEAMQKRIQAYQTYQKKYGGSDISDIASGYKDILGQWDSLTSLYGNYKNADAFNSAKKKAQFDSDFAGLTYDQVQAKKKEYAEDSDEYKYLSEYMNYSDLADFDKALENTADYDYYNKLKKAMNQYELEHASDRYAHLEEKEDFKKLSQYASTISSDAKWWQNEIGDETYEYINNYDGKIRGELNDQHRKYSSDSAITTLSSYEERNLDQLNEQEIKYYNYLYATEGKDSAETFLRDMETTLGKRATDKRSASIQETVDNSILASIGLSAISPILNIGGGIYSGVDNLGSMLKGEELNPYGGYQGISNMASDIRTHVGENIEESTEGMELFGQNMPRFLYDTGMSVADSTVGAVSLGRAYTPLMGMSAYQQKARELTEAGEDADTIHKLSMANGLAEAVFEYASIDKLLKIKDVDSLGKFITQTAKQMGIEASEEIFTETSNILMDKFIRGDGSDLGQMKQDLISRGYSEEEAEREVKKQALSQIGWAGIGGALSGGVMGGVASGSNWSQESITEEKIGSKDAISKRVKSLAQGEVTEVTATGNSAKIEGIKLGKDKNVLLTSEGEVSVDDMTFTSNDAELVAYAETMSEEKANLLLSQYDGQSNVNEYVDSFELAYEYGEKGFGAESALEKKGVLSASQVGAIYNGAIRNQAISKQRTIDELNEKHASKMVVAGKFDDSVIDRTDSDKGEVNWKDLTSKQRSAVNFAKAFSKVTGVNITFSTKGAEQGFNGFYDSNSNTITIDVYAGIDRLGTNKKTWTDSIVSTLSHEMTHLMKEKSPAMYNKMREHIMDTMEMDGKIWSDLVNSQMEKTEENHPELKGKISEEYAEDEVIARACEDMLSNNKTARKLLETMSESEQKTFISEVKKIYNRLIDWVNDLLAQYKSNSTEAKILRDYQERLEELSEMWDKALAEAIQTNQSLQKEGKTAEEFLKSAIVQFSDKVDEKMDLDATVEQTKDLVAVHNLTEDKLAKTFKLEGFPMPSIAITKAALGHSNFGSISFVFGKETIDPSNRKNKVYAADSWTPTFPRVEYEANAERIREIKNELEPLIVKIPDRLQYNAQALISGLDYNLDNYGGYEGVVARALSDEAIKQIYLATTNDVVEDVVIEKKIEMDEMDIEISKNIIELLGDDVAEISRKTGNEIYNNYGQQIIDAMRKAYISFGISDEGAENVINNTNKFGIVKQLRLAKDYLNNGGVKIETGIDYSATRNEIDSKINIAKYEEWVRKTFNGIVANEGVYNGKERFTPSGNRRSFSQTHLPVTADNIVKAMIAQSDDVRNVAGFNGIKSIRAVAVEEFKNIKSIREARNKLQNIDSIEYEAMNEELSERLNKVLGSIVESSDKRKTDNWFIDVDNVGYAVLDACANPKTSNIRKLIEGYRWTCTDAQAKEIESIIDEVRNMPVNMFESKPQRVVGFNEIKYAIVPDDISAASRKLIEEKGIPIKEYESGNDQSRMNELNSLEGVKFSDRDSSYKTDIYYSKITPASRKDAEHLNMLDERNIARYRREIDGVFDGSFPTGRDIIIGMPSRVLKEYGVSDRVIHMSQRIVRKIAYPLGYKIGNAIINRPAEQKVQGDMEGKHNLGISAVKNLPLQIADPIAITKNNEQNSNKNSIVIWTNWITEDGKGVMLGLVIDSKGATGLQNNVSTVFQADEEYAKRFFENEEDILYTKNKKDINQLLSVRRYMPKARVDDTFIRNVADKYPDVKWSDREKTLVYDVMGENESLKKQNQKLSEDIERLRERLKLEKTITNGNTFNKNQLDAVAGHIRKLANSTYDKAMLVDELNEVYSYIVQTPNLIWDNLMAKCYEVASNILREQRGTKITDDYFKQVLTEIRKARISLSEEQIQEAKNVYGDKYRNAFMGRIMITKDGISLDRQWQEWSAKYPEIFDADTTLGNQITALSNIYDYLREGAESYQMFNDVENTRALAVEIYNQYWNVSTIRTAADKYDKQIKRINFEHRKAIGELRTDYKTKVENQKVADAIHYGKIINNIRQKKEAEVQQAREFGRRRVNEYRDRAERNAKIKSITNKALVLNKWLTKNSKNEHINEALKGPVINLLQAIDFSSRQLLGMSGGSKSGTETQKDISLSKALSQVKDMMADANVGKEELISLYGIDMDEDIKELVDSVDHILRNVGDNEYVLNQMSLEELKTLDKMVGAIKHAVTQMNKFHTVNHAKGIASLSQSTIIEVDSLGKAKIHDGMRGWTDKLLNWGNALPYYAFKRFGEGGRKVYEAFQDGWDKFAFHVKEIIDYTGDTYTSKEVKAWGEDIKTFKILVPEKDADSEDLDYVPEYQNVQMTVPQIMSLYCLQKREQAKGHMLGGGIRVADIKTKKGIVSQSDGVILGQEDIIKIIESLTDRQITVADTLQEFMNTTCTDWGNEVSMLRFGYKAFGEENYFPIQSDKNNLAVNDETEQNNSLFRLLNMSFTKSITDQANNRIVISDIFDVFAQHTSDMAKYNALALPVLDAFRWYNYKEKGQKGETQFITKSVKQSLEKAFGKDAQNYITTFLRDINGSENTSRDTVGKHFFSNAKIASVAANLRVAFLQPTSYLRAGAVIDTKYLTKALIHTPKIGRAEKYCGIAQWKALGFYDTNIQRGVTSLIKHDETWKDKAIEKSMKGAEWGDKITWGYLWNACELEVREKQKNLKVGSDEFYTAIGKRLREVIYATQVVDSTMTRSQMMRSSDMYDKMLTSFASEPTLAYNMMQDVSWEIKLAKRRGEGQSEMRKHRRHFVRVAMAYTITNIACALIESGFDAFRDDEEEEIDLETFMKMYLSNFLTDMSFTGKIPYIKEFTSILQGFTSSRTDTQWMQSFGYALKGITKIVTQGEGNVYSAFKNLLKGFSYVSGLPFYNAWRDSMSLLDKTNILTSEELEEMFNSMIE